MFGETLAELRKDNGYDQKQLGKLLGVSYHTISSYERGRSQPNHEMLIKIAKLFDVSLDYLLGLRRDKVSYKDQTNIVIVPKCLPRSEYTKIEEYIQFLISHQENTEQ